MMALDRSSGTALWRQIQRIIEGRISQGLFCPGERLPTEHEFALHFGVNRHTVRQAIGGLVERGLLRVEQGRGTFVREPVIEVGLSGVGLPTDAEAFAGRGRRTEIVGRGEEPASREVAAALGGAAGALVDRVDMVGEIDAHRVLMATVYLPRARGGLLAEALAATGTLEAALLRMGLGACRATMGRLLARLPTPAEGRVLGLARNRPLLVTEAGLIDASGRPVAYRVVRYVGGWVRGLLEPG
ncbi:phosphonate metabolism transcriptional regulator PhnF [Pararhodospirillum oryzae]|uniref:Phosphonate metabolism transcriptional regulator PhnF n=1 Tax=Pararhodospirillum oryzae TaxID=478448 RepID=A0A512H531_9PROT|nr:phosphonate metabolism transcriptional regulator PhnF [Pararhodospirillum oryzae]GEO80553.1 phosphonate metabolism transcriptional regulator PhnF [Pararhodospirillum oryzae]